VGAPEAAAGRAADRGVAVNNVSAYAQDSTGTPSVLTANEYYSSEHSKILSDLLRSLPGQVRFDAGTF